MQTIFNNITKETAIRSFLNPNPESWLIVNYDSSAFNKLTVIGYENGSFYYIFRDNMPLFQSISFNTVEIQREDAIYIVNSSLFNENELECIELINSIK